MIKLSKIGNIYLIMNIIIIIDSGLIVLYINLKSLWVIVQQNTDVSTVAIIGLQLDSFY